MAAGFVCQTGWSHEKKSDPATYLDFMELIKTSNSSKTIQFPISLADIQILEEVNREQKTRFYLELMYSVKISYQNSYN